MECVSNSPNLEVHIDIIIYYMACQLILTWDDPLLHLFIKQVYMLCLASCARSIIRLFSSVKYK